MVKIMRLRRRKRRVEVNQLLMDAQKDSTETASSNMVERERERGDGKQWNSSGEYMSSGRWVGVCYMNWIK